MAISENRFPAGWYAVLAQSELRVDKPFGKTLFNRKIVFWRSQNGVQAFEDSCPHRHAALSLGRINNGDLECPYHGLRFNSQGNCTLIPEIKSAAPASLKKYEVKEDHGFIWIKYGVNVAQESPNWFSQLNTQNFVESKFNWQQSMLRSLENQLDLAHLPIVHRNTIGKYFKYDLLATETEADENSIKINWNKPANLTNPDLEFKAPNLIYLKISNFYKIVFAVVPISDCETQFYQRSYVTFLSNALLRATVGSYFKKNSLKIFTEDRNVVVSQPPLPEAEKSASLLFSDKAINYFRKWWFANLTSE